MFTKGQSGNPFGASISDGRPITAALRIVLSETDKKTKKVKARLFADMLYKNAMAGSAPHAHMILDRLDGKLPLPIRNETPVDPAEAGRKSEQAERLIAVLQELADKKSCGEAIPKLLDVVPTERK